MAHLILVDDDPEIRQLLTDYLSQNGFAVTAYADAESLLAGEISGDCLVLDIGLPGMDGLACCRVVRQRSQIPIIMLTAASDDVDRILGLELGADDYMGKPFNPRELLARIRALLRRSATPIKPGLALSVDRRTVIYGEQQVELSGAEFAAFQTLFDLHPEVASREQLSQSIHGRNPLAFDRTVDTTVSRLRARLQGLGVDDCIRNVRGKGYVLVKPQ